MAKTEQPPLFSYEDVLSDIGLEKVWVDALELGRHPLSVPYGRLTAEDIIDGVVEEHGLRAPTPTTALGDFVLEVANGLADYEQEQFERASREATRD